MACQRQLTFRCQRSFSHKRHAIRPGVAPFFFFFFFLGYRGIVHPLPDGKGTERTYFAPEQRGLLAALVVNDLQSDACGVFRCMYM